MITLIVFGSCKDENTNLESITSELEKAYFEDYQTPLLKWGFIDPFGEFQIPPIYDDVRYFKNGLACASKFGRWGVIDEKNNEIVMFQYLNIQDFSEEKALVQDFDHNKFYINLNGQKVIDCPYDECYAYFNGRARFKENEIYGYMDLKGNAIPSMRYSNAGNFTNGYAVIGIGDQYGVIDTAGNQLIDINYDRIRISEGVAMLKKDGVYSYFKIKENKSLPGAFRKGAPFKDGIAIITNEDGIGYLTLSGNIVKLGGERAFYINEERVAVKSNGKYKIIDLDGNEISSETYDNVFKYHCGIAGFEQEGFWGYVDTKGNEVLPPQLPIIWDCSDGRVRIINPSGFSYMDSEMKEVIRPQFIESRDFREGLAPAQSTSIQ